MKSKRVHRALLYKCLIVKSRNSDAGQKFSGQTVARKYLIPSDLFVAPLPPTTPPGTRRGGPLVGGDPEGFKNKRKNVEKCNCNQTFSGWCLVC